MVRLDHLIIGLFFLLSILEGAARSRFNWDDDNFVCKKESGYYPDPKDCSAYYKCNFWNPIKEVCSPGLYFNSKIVACDWPEKVNCTTKDGQNGDTIQVEVETTTSIDLSTNNVQSSNAGISTTIPSTLPITNAIPEPSTPEPGSPAVQCELSNCLLPNCRCDSSEIPGNLTVEQVPQMILLSFEDSVNEANILIYKSIFKQSRTNPNNCTIKGSFFVSHSYTDYSMVQELYYNGHEIASRSISSMVNAFSENIKETDWKDEINGQREILSKFGNINFEDIRGMRAPSVQIGGDDQFRMLYEESFVYDSSISVPDPPIYPFTLDYLFNKCMIDPCPTVSIPGLWEMPLVIWFDLNGFPCVNADSCQYPNSSDGVYQVLKKNFDRHYMKNRAPLNVVFGSGWFALKHQKEGFEKFLSELTSMKDVWFVTMYQAIQWIKSPTPLSKITSFNPWTCKNNEKRPVPCKKPKHCQLWHNGGVKMLKTCQECPKAYPWVGNPLGEILNVTH